MRRRIAGIATQITALMLTWTAAAAEATDIRTQCCTWGRGLVGSGSIVIPTNSGPQLSIGADATLVPVSETNWDFGFHKFAQAGIGGVAGGKPAAGSDFYATHISEAGDVVGGDYFRNQFNLYLNVLPDDAAWSLFVQLQYDQANDVPNEDAAGGAGVQKSDLGLERLHISAKLPWSDNQRLHAGFDFYDVDTVEGAGLLFGDDPPGIWITGQPVKSIFYSVSYFFINDANIGNSNFSFADAGKHDDRNALMAYMDWEFAPSNKIRFMYAFDQIQSAKVIEQNLAFLNMPAGLGAGSGTVAGAGVSPTLGGTGGKGSDADVHNIGAYWKGSFDKVDLLAEGIYKFGTATNVGLSGVNVDQAGDAGRDSYRISSYAAAAAAKLTIGSKLSTRLSVLYASGDSNPRDGKLGGYVAVMSDQRFSPWGHMASFLGNGNFLLGLPVFSHLPEALGNGTPVNVGGVANFRNTGGAGRGDNPGYFAVTLDGDYALAPSVNVHTRLSAFGWNEDFVVNNVLNASPGFSSRNPVRAGYAGTEWGNELSWHLNKQIVLLVQGSVLLPGKGISDLTRASGAKADDLSTRFAVALEFAI